MRIVFTSNLYLPVMGGSVMVLDRLSRELGRMGHQVVILTKTPGDGFSDFREWEKAQHLLPPGEIAVCRFSGFQESVDVLKSADRVVMIEMSIHWLLAIAAASRRPLVTHHTHFRPLDGKMRAYRILQYIAGLLVPSVACSKMIARQWGPHVGVLPNPYDIATFHDSGLERDIDFLFAGRFGPEKGAILFIRALEQIMPEFISAHGRSPRFAIAGQGPDEEEMRASIDKAGLMGGVMHFGLSTADELSVLYNRTRIVVVPSVWREPFGLIGVEALACGCQVLCSDQPGLREATGGMATYFETGNIGSLAQAMLEIAAGKGMRPDPRSREAHLARYHVASSVDCLLQSVTRWNNSPSARHIGLSNRK